MINGAMLTEISKTEKIILDIINKEDKTYETISKSISKKINNKYTYYSLGSLMKKEKIFLYENKVSNIEKKLNEKYNIDEFNKNLMCVWNILNEFIKGIHLDKIQRMATIRNNHLSKREIQIFLGFLIEERKVKPIYALSKRTTRFSVI